MSTPKRPPLPLILLANDLLDGDIMFWTGSRWSLHLADALIANDEATVAQLETAAEQGRAANKVIDTDIISVTLDEAGAPRPRHARERIKTLGPTVRLDLGKQATKLQAALPASAIRS